MALTLKDLLAARDELRAKEGAPERVSVSNLQDLAQQEEKLDKPTVERPETRAQKSDADIKKQNALLAAIEKNTNSTKILDELKRISSAFTGKGGNKPSKKDGIQELASELRKHTSLLTNLQQKNKNDHSSQIVGELKALNKKLDGGVKVKSESSDKKSYEEVIETRRLQEEQVSLTRKLLENEEEKQSATKEKTGGSSFDGVGGILTALAAGLGAAVGYITGYVKMLKTLFQMMPPNKITTAIAGAFEAVIGAFSSIKGIVAELFVGAKTALAEMLGKSKIVGVIGGFLSPVFEFFASLKKGWDLMAEGSAFIKKGLDWIGGIVDAVKTFFGTASKMGGSFVKVFSGAMKIFEKLALPLTVIMGIYDTLKGAFKGWEEGGFIGAIRGAITGLINSIIGAPLDLLKSIVSWVLGAFGFDKAEKFLDSFSFEDIIEGFFKAIFAPLQLIQDLIMHPIDTIKKMGEQISSMLESIGIPEISFTIPIIDKKVSIGPFYPFKKSASASGSSAGSSETKQSSTAPSSDAKGTTTVGSPVAETSTKPGRRPGEQIQQSDAEKATGSTGDRAQRGSIGANAESAPATSGAAVTSYASSTSTSNAPVTSSTLVNGAPVTSSTSTSNAPVTSSTQVSNAPVTSSTQVSNAPVTSSTSTSNAPVTSSTLVNGAPVTSSTQVSNAPVTSSTLVNGAPVTSSTQSSTLIKPTSNLEILNKSQESSAIQQPISGNAAQTPTSASIVTQAPEYQSVVIQAQSATLTVGSQIQSSAEAIGSYRDSATPSGAISVASPSPIEANAVYARSAGNAEAAMSQSQATQPVIVNAPTNISNSSKQNIAMPSPVRNTDSGLSSYISKSAVFI